MSMAWRSSDSSFSSVRNQSVVQITDRIQEQAIDADFSIHAMLQQETCLRVLCWALVFSIIKAYRKHTKSKG